MSRAVSSARIHFESSTLVLTVAAGGLGSLAIERLTHLESEFQSWLTTSARTVIVDLTNVTDAGSGLLGCLARFRQQLQRAGKKLVVCGDRCGLVEHVGWSTLMCLQADVPQALRQAVRTWVSI